jgi:hypothetical protein
MADECKALGRVPMYFCHEKIITDQIFLTMKSILGMLIWACLAPAAYGQVNGNRPEGEAGSISASYINAVVSSNRFVCNG